jgi:hypothetical protein
MPLGLLRLGNKMDTCGPNLNLNFSPILKGRKKWKARESKDFYYKGKIKFAGRETDMQECKECHEILPVTAYTKKGISTMRSDGAHFLRKTCRQCRTVLNREMRAARKSAPPKPEHCDCCHKKEEKLQADHVHGSTAFRGWPCKDCNTGIGLFGDNLKGILQAAVYLENDKNKIIETLHEVFNEKK